MTIGSRLMTCIGLSSALMLSACSHDWDALEPLSGGGTSSTSASTASSGSGAGGGGSSSAGTGGAADGCGPLLPSVDACDDLVSAFDDPAEFNAEWALSEGDGQIAVVNGEGVFDLAATDDTVFAATHPDFTLKDCAIWVEIVAAASASDAMVRLSLSNPFAQSRCSFGVIDKHLEAYIDGTSVFSTPYDPSSMRYVRMREEGGDIHFGYSTDAHCWNEVFSANNVLDGDVEGRLAVKHIPEGPGSEAQGRFDNYCISPP